MSADNSSQDMIVSVGGKKVSLTPDSEMLSTLAVSYTHLDVYKRQCLFCACLRSCLKMLLRITTMCKSG